MLSSMRMQRHDRLLEQRRPAHLRLFGSGSLGKIARYHYSGKPAEAPLGGLRSDYAHRQDPLWRRGRSRCSSLAQGRVAHLGRVHDSAVSRRRRPDGGCRGYSARCDGSLRGSESAAQGISGAAEIWPRLTAPLKEKHRRTEPRPMFDVLLPRMGAHPRAHNIDQRSLLSIARITTFTSTICGLAWRSLPREPWSGRRAPQAQRQRTRHRWERIRFARFC